MSVNVSQRDHVAVIELNRPEVRNAVDSATALALDGILDKLGADREVWAVVITGTGDRAFCAGQDLRDLTRRDGDEAPRPRPAGGWGGITRRDFPKPLIAAVNGVALGGGFEIVLACDLVVAEEHAQFGLPEVLRGVAASAGGLVRIARRLPASVALELALTGRPVAAARAHELGLVNRVVPQGQALAVALDLAAQICAASPLAVEVAKRLVTAAIRQGEQQLFELQEEYVGQLKRSDDFAEGIRAFLEKRPPNWCAQ